MNFLIFLNFSCGSQKFFLVLTSGFRRAGPSLLQFLAGSGTSPGSRHWYWLSSVGFSSRGKSTNSWSTGTSSRCPATARGLAAKCQLWSPSLRHYPRLPGSKTWFEKRQISSSRHCLFLEQVYWWWPAVNPLYRTGWPLLSRWRLFLTLELCQASSNLAGNKLSFGQTLRFRCHSPYFFVGSWRIPLIQKDPPSQAPPQSDPQIS